MAAVTEILETMDYGPARESDAAVRDWLARHEGAFGPLIDGGFHAAADSERLTVRNPATGEVLAQVAAGGAAEIAAAVGAAKTAFEAWSALPGHRRARHLYALARRLEKRAAFFAVLISLETGRPLRDSRDIDLPLAIQHFDYAAGWAELVESEFAGYCPLGVCGEISARAGGLSVLAGKLASALAAGNSLVVVPPERAPLSALALAEVVAEAGLPSGVVNIVTGEAAGAALIAHENIARIGFTGPVARGREIRKALAGTGKELALDLGTTTPFLVFADADLDAAVESLVDGSFLSEGQSCCAGMRLLVQEGVAERLHTKLKRRMAKLQIGDPLETSTDCGPLADDADLTRLTGLVAMAGAEGAEVWQADADIPGEGRFFPPTLVSDVAPAMGVAEAEIAGPIIRSTTFRTPDEALKLANHSRYGRAVAVFSENAGLALEMATKLQTSVVWVNGTNFFDAAVGVGGVKESGFGRDGGREGLSGYLKPAWPRGSIPADLPKTDLSAVSKTKHINGAVDAAAKASGWAAMSGHERAQRLYRLAETLEARASELAARPGAANGGSAEAVAEEVALSAARIAYYAAWADKFDGAVHSTRARHLTIAIQEPLGVMGILCPPQAPLLGLVSLVAPAIAMGNRVVVVPSVAAPLAALDFSQALAASGVPSGVVNIVTGDPLEISATLGGHDDVAACWHFAGPDGVADFEREAAGSLKVIWSVDGRRIDWRDAGEGQGRDYLVHATQLKNIWVPYEA
ncbi:aldehyde dehydrogenase family protein [Afifella sp. JA880]|uniref:aldehyde dehydrogenase family protein n=1 Tax=Afifella sp. JA880 TaxID=2975280 RepID=UPI0021BAF462|nr:aldehyde dehydrogenase family protein [Afifella sp. JA880]MCT8266533.1 aldehyde dehydrogenase family protein [Afifella sp. JA880]